MTLSSKLCKVIHQFDPTVTVYSFPFKIFKKHEAAVWILGPDCRESARLRLDGDYLISGLESDSGGEISLTESGLTLAAAGQSLLIIRDMDFTQNIDYRPHDIFPARSHEEALDLLTMQNHQLLEMIQRAPLLPIGRQAGDPWGEFAGLAGRAHEAAQAAESAARGATDSGREAAASAQAALEAALKAEKSLSSLISHNGEPNAHEIFTGDRLRYRLTRDTVFYVRPDGHDNNDGSADTPASALKTTAGALSLLRRTDQRGYRATISLAPGRWNHINIDGAAIGGLIRITSTDPADLAFVAITVTRGAYASIDNLGIDVSLGYYGLSASSHSSLFVEGPITITGAGAGYTIMVSQSYLRFNAANVPVVFDDVKNIIIVGCVQSGAIEFLSAVLSGTATGRRFAVGTTGLIQTMNRGPDYIPGTIAGTIDAGGYYI